MLSPKPSKKSPKVQPAGLPAIMQNMLTLYMKAKHFHFNTTGPSFYGDHKTYDGIADVAIEQFDIIGERMRALQMPAMVCPEAVAECNILPMAKSDSREDMIENMLESLSVFSRYISSWFEYADETTANILQETVAALDKQAYFIRSSR